MPDLTRSFLCTPCKTIPDAARHFQCCMYVSGFCTRFFLEEGERGEWGGGGGGGGDVGTGMRQRMHTCISALE